MQTPPGKCKQTISLNFLTLDTSKNICNKLSCRVFFFFVFFFPFLSFLTQRLSEANRLSVQDNHNKLLLFFSSSPSSLSSCSPPIPSPYFTFSNVSITAGHKPPCCACVCVRVQEGEKERLRRITSKISPAFYAQMSSLSLPLSPPLMWPVLISGADIAAVPSPLVEKDSFPTEKDALEHSTRRQHRRAHSHTQTHSSTFEQWEEAALTENGFFWGGEWKDQVAVKSTKPRATLRAARCQQLLFCLSMCCTHSHTHTRTHTNTPRQGLKHTTVYDKNKQHFGL